MFISGQLSTLAYICDCKISLRDAFQCIVQPNTTLLDCILYLTLTQYPYDPGTLPSFANQCILGKCILIYLDFIYQGKL